MWGQTQLICCFSDLSRTHLKGLREIKIKIKGKRGKNLHENTIIWRKKCNFFKIIFSFPFHERTYRRIRETTNQLSQAWILRPPSRPREFWQKGVCQNPDPVTTILSEYTHIYIFTIFNVIIITIMSESIALVRVPYIGQTSVRTPLVAWRWRLLGDLSDRHINIWC